MEIKHQHWEFDSTCPKCERVNHIKAPVGENVVLVKCKYCKNAHEYTHVIREHSTIDD